MIKLTEMFVETKADLNMVFREMSENSLTSLEKPASTLWALGQLSKHRGYSSFLAHYTKKLEESGKL